jgi:hypothetical protein
MNAPPRAGVPALLPLSLLEALRALDVPQPDTLDEPHGDLAAKRLGLSRTVEAEIERLRRRALAGEAVPGQEFAALQRLVSRRPDAALVFTDAGRRAARRALERRSAPSRALRRILPGTWGRRFGLQVAARIARGTFGVGLEGNAGRATRAVLHGALAVVSEPGSACSFIGAALAELLRQLAGFDGAMVHTNCRKRGSAECAWSATTAPDAQRSS